MFSLRSIYGVEFVLFLFGKSFSMCLLLLRISCLVSFPSFDIVCPTLIGFHLCPIYLPLLVHLILFAFPCHHQCCVLPICLCIGFSKCSWLTSIPLVRTLFSFLALFLFLAWHPLNLYIFSTDKYWTNWTYSSSSVQQPPIPSVFGRLDENISLLFGERFIL